MRSLWDPLFSLDTFTSQAGVYWGCNQSLGGSILPETEEAREAGGSISTDSVDIAQRTLEIPFVVRDTRVRISGPEPKCLGQNANVSLAGSPGTSHREESTYRLIHAERFEETNALSDSQQGLAPHLTPSTAVDAPVSAGQTCSWESVVHLELL